MILDVQQLSMNFGGLTALLGIDLQVEEKEIRGLIGPNGAGKTTFFNVVTGVYKPSKGEVFFEGKEITGKKTFEIARKGICRTFQNIRIFGNMTAKENVMVGRHTLSRSELFGAIIRLPRVKREEREIEEKGKEILYFLKLDDVQNELARNLSYGQQRLLEIGRVLAAEPRLLLLDEPSAGMNIKETSSLIELIKQLRERGLTVLVVEHDMRLVMNLSDKITVLNFGQKIAEGPPSAIKVDPIVINAYLGKAREI